MQARSVITAVALVAGLSAFAAPLTPPAPQRFRITTTNHQVVDLSAFSQPEQVTHIVTSAFVTVTSADSAGGRAVKMTIDSVKLDTLAGDAPLTQANFDSLRGTVATGWVGANGSVQNAKGEGERGPQAVNMLTELFPKVGNRAKVGDKWTDTTETTGMGAGILANASVRRVTNWAVSGEETIGGTKARKVDGAYSQSVSGSMESPQGTLTVDGTGTGTASYALTADGRMLRGSTLLNLQIAVSIPQAPEPIPVNGTMNSTITALR
jgi:hypothetical protein